MFKKHKNSTPKHKTNKTTQLPELPKTMERYIMFKKHKNSTPKHKTNKKVQVGKDQEKAQSEKDSHSKNRGGKKPN